MKTLKSIFIFGLLAVLALSCTKEAVKTRAINPTRVAIVYTSDVANSITGAAIAMIKYENHTVINIDNMTTAQQLSAIQTITDSVHRVLLMVDTATTWATNKLTGAQYDSLVARMYVDSAYGVAPDTIPTYYQATATKNLAEIVWTDVYPDYTLPLGAEYLGDDVFALKMNRFKHVSTDSSAVDTTGSMSSGAYNGDYLYIYSGKGIGQLRQIVSNTTTTFYVTPDWTVNPNKTSLYKVKNSGEQHEAFYDQYFNNYVLAYMRNLSSQNVKDKWYKLFDMYYNINNGNVSRTPYQDVKFLNDSVLVKGKAIFDYAINTQDD